MRIGWLVVAGMLWGGNEASAQPRTGEVVTPTRPTARYVAGMLGLDPKHEKVTAVVVGDHIWWRRSYDGIPVLIEPVSWKQGRVWRTVLRAPETKPAAVRRSDVLSPGAAIEKAALDKVFTPYLAGKDPVADLSYRPHYVRRERPWTLSIETAVERVDLVYIVHPRGQPFPFVVLDAYTGSMLAKDSGIRD